MVVGGRIQMSHVLSCTWNLDFYGTLNVKGDSLWSGIRPAREEKRDQGGWWGRAWAEH